MQAIDVTYEMQGRHPLNVKLLNSLALKILATCQPCELNNNCVLMVEVLPTQIVQNESLKSLALRSSV